MVCLAALAMGLHAAAAPPQNIAPSAEVSASSEYSEGYAARFAVDGQIPQVLSKDDVGRAWAINGAQAQGAAAFVLEWPEPVQIAEIIYYGRTAWLVEECWRTYAVRLDDRPEPVATGRFMMKAGPQRVRIEPTKARRATLEFIDSYGGLNPGAAEIEVYSIRPPDSALPKLKTLPSNLAVSARVSASSEYSDDYLAQFAVDGTIPQALSGLDQRQAWAIKGHKARGKATFTLQWDEPVLVAEVIYYGRTAVLIEEGFKDYELWLDDDTQPVAKGAFEYGTGPQRIPVQARKVRRVRLELLSSYGGPNPGASEIQVYDKPPDPQWLPRFLKDGWDKPKESPELTRLAQERKLGFDRLLLIQRHEMNPSHVYTVHCEGFRPGGGLYELSPATEDGKLTQLLASPEGQILDYDLSCDAAELVVSWRRSAPDSYHVYRMNVDGSGLQQLTQGPWHDYNARWLPDGGIAFVSTRSGQFAMCFVTPSGTLHRMNRDGTGVRRLSSNYIDDFTPAVMPDGRLLHSRWEYVDKPAIPIQSLWTINPDGTGASVFYGNRVLSPASFLEARPIPGTDRVICTLTAHNGPIRGGIGIIDRKWGVNAQEAISNVTPMVDIGRVDQGSGNHVRGAFENPYPLDAERFLVSGKGSVYVGDVAGRWAVVRQRPSGPGLGYYCPQPLRPRPRPPIVASSLPSVPEATAKVFVLDVYEGLLPHVQRGEVKQLCVVEEVKKPLRTSVLGFGFQRPVISCGATYAAKKVWGYAPVRQDGSAFFTVPSDLPIYFEALDASGQALQRMRSFDRFEPGELRGCIGCHEPRNRAPGLRRAKAPVGSPVALRPPEWGVESFDYSRVVQPVLDRHCVSCHNGPRPASGIDLTGGKTDWFSVSYDVLTRGWVNWIDTRNGQEHNILQITPKRWGSPASRLTKLLLDGHKDKSGKPRVALSDAARRRILTWIDLNVPYYSTYEMAHPQAEGGRRLYPAGLDEVLRDVSARRCASCHAAGVPSSGFIRITEPEMSDFLLAPLAKSAGGRQSCGKAVFADKDDPDYQAVLRAFAPVQAKLAQAPRMDMPGARPAAADRSCR